MGYALKLVTPPTEQPVTLDEAKKQVEIATSVEYHDDHLLRLIKSATEAAQVRAGLQILTATYRLTIDAFPAESDSRILVPMPPLQSVSSIAYLDSNGVSQTLATTYYRVLTDREPGEIILRYGQTWPSTYDEPQAVTINYLAGIADTTAELCDKDEWIKEATLLLVQALWLRDFGQVNGKIFERVDQILEAHRCGDDFFQYGEE